MSLFPASRRCLLLVLACLAWLALPALAAPEEGWSRLLIDGVQVGYSHDLADDISYLGRPARHLSTDWLLSFKRSGIPIQVRGHSEVTYGPDLRPLLVQELDTAQAQPITLEARWDGQAWQITRSMAGRKTEKRWQPERPAYSLELVPLLVVRDKALPGGTRRYPVYDFQKLQVVDTPVQVTLAPGPLHSGEVPYARLDYAVLDEPISEWIDAQGNTLKAAHASFEAYNCTREQAEQFEVKEILPMEVAVVRLASPLPEPMDVADVKLKVHFPTAAMARTLVPTENQRILKQQQGDLLVELREPIGADPRSTGMPAVTPSLKPYLAADDHIQSDDPAIIAQARSVVAGEKEPVRMADRLTEWVHEHVDYTLEVLLTSALATFTSHRGDCKGYAALLTAMARSVGLPAREVFGLAYDPPHQAFAGHAWTEIYLGGRWIPYDATAGRMPTATYIQLRDLSPMDALYHIRDMRIDVVEVKKHREL